MGLEGARVCLLCIAGFLDCVIAIYLSRISSSNSITSGSSYSSISSGIVIVASGGVITPVSLG